MRRAQCWERLLTSSSPWWQALRNWYFWHCSAMCPLHKQPNNTTMSDSNSSRHFFSTRLFLSFYVCFVASLSMPRDFRPCSSYSDSLGSHLRGAGVDSHNHSQVHQPKLFPRCVLSYQIARCCIRERTKLKAQAYTRLLRLGCTSESQDCSFSFIHSQQKRICWHAYPGVGNWFTCLQISFFVQIWDMFAISSKSQDLATGI